MQSNAQGSVHGTNGEGEGDKAYWHFTDHPGFPGYSVITNKRYPAFLMGQRDSWVYDGYIEGYKGDPGAQAYWKVTVVKKIDADNDIITLQTMNKPNEYAYLTMSSDPALQSMRNPPMSQAQFKRTLMSQKLRLLPNGTPRLDWEFLETTPAVQAGRSTTVVFTYNMETKTSFTTSTTLDVEYLGNKAGLRTEFTASLAVATSYQKTEVITGPVEQQSYFRQVVVIPTPKGDVTLPTGHVVSVRRYSDLTNDDFIPLGQLKSVSN